MKIFVTGGTGFVGSYFLNQALAEGHDVIALRRTSNSVSGVALLNEPQWLEKSLDEVTVDDFKGCSVLVHLATAGATPQPATWQGCFQINVVDTLKLVETAHKAGVSRIIAAGSYSEYGYSGSRYEHIPSNAPLEPTGPYAASKAASSIALNAFARRTGIELCYGRIFSAYGEGQFKKNLWPSLKEAANKGEDFEMTQGEQIRDFVSVELVAAWFVDHLDKPISGSSQIVVENVASGNPVTLASFCSTWWGKFNADGKLLIGALPYRDGEVMRYVPEV